MFQAGNHLMGFWAGGSLLTNYPAYDSAGSSNAVTATPVQPVYPATLDAGDWLLLVVCIAHSTSTPSVTTPAGWSALPGGTAADSTGADRIGIFTFSKTSDGTEDGTTLNVTVSMAGANNVALARIYRFTTTSAVEAIGVTVQWNSALIDPCLGNYGSWDGVSLTVGGLKRLSVQVVCMNNDWSSGLTVPSGYSSAVASATTVGGDASIGITTKQIDANASLSSYEVISAAGVAGNDAGDGYTVGFALVGT